VTIARESGKLEERSCGKQIKMGAGLLDALSGLLDAASFEQNAVLVGAEQDGF